MSITVHCIVKNEENFIWFALQSVLPFVERLIVWDTGSTDKTVEIIRSIKNPKIEFMQKGTQTPEGISKLRQEMLKITTSDWIMVLDGDEIWWNEALVYIKSLLERTKADVIVNPCYMLIGDMYHYQSSKAGRYKIKDRTGHYNIRFFRNLSGIYVDGIYPYEAYITKEGILLQNLDEERILFSDLQYLHASHLIRSTKVNRKFKYELGIKLPNDFYYPESFFQAHHKIRLPWVKRNFWYILRSSFETPVKLIKRRVLYG